MSVRDAGSDGDLQATGRTYPPILDPSLHQRIALARRVGVLGCGSPFRGDDAAGTLLAEALSLSLPAGSRKARAWSGGAAPENLTGEVKRFAPELLLAVDAVDMGAEPGDVAIVPMEAIGGVSFSTHKLPLPIVLDYLVEEIGCEVWVLGIQIGGLGFLGEITPAVRETVEALTAELLSLLG